MLRPSPLEVLFGSGFLSAKLFGQSPVVDPTLGLIGTLVGNVGIVGVLIWHLWYHTTKSYPQMLERFSAEQAASRASYEAEQKSSRATFLLEQQALRDYTGKETAALRDMFLQSLQEHRRAVHDMRDTAQTVVTQTAAAAAAVLKKDSN